MRTYPNVKIEVYRWQSIKGRAPARECVLCLCERDVHHRVAVCVLVDHHDGVRVHCVCVCVWGFAPDEIFRTLTMLCVNGE